LDRSNYTSWVSQGKQTLGDRAAARARQLLETHHCPPLPAAVAQQVAAIIARANQR
jgi:trimethylamine:corrinoid methyltransferase-like protein